MITNRLCNPTPFEVVWNWHLGIVIRVQPDSHYDLSNQQLVDFQPGQPGSEGIKQLMDELGVFLRDTDRTYEAQALECLKACLKARKQHYDEGTNNIRKNRASSGIVDDPAALEETFKQMGYLRLRDQVERLQFRVKMFGQAVDEQKANTVESDVDPDRTLLFTDPPKTFESKFALAVFLSEPGNEKLKSQYTQWRAAYNQGN